MLLPIAASQIAKKATASKGPRALALLELAANGKAHLVPVAIMENGQFYDASAYKADPVPMALQSGTVYEVEQAGVSKGLFTVGGARQVKDSWTAEGKWEPGGPKIKVTTIGKPSKPPDEDTDKPPVLRRSGGAKPPDSSPSNSSTTPGSPTTPNAPSGPPATAPKSADSTAPAGQPTSATVPSEAPPDDADRPVLRRGMPAAKPETAEKSAAEPVVKSSTTAGGSSPAMGSAAAAKPAKPAEVQIIPAISDAGGPEPRSYVFDTKPEEEQEFRTKMLAMVSAELLGQKKKEDTTPPSSKSGARRRAAEKAPQPSFDDVQLRVFDLSSSNEPTVVLSATARMPASAEPRFVTLVARNDIYNELHKVLLNVTDAQHLDVTPRLELIDAVDADGDGRGELLFRQTSDNGSNYVVYRVIGDQVYALYQGTSGG